MKRRHFGNPGSGSYEGNDGYDEPEVTYSPRATYLAFAVTIFMIGLLAYLP